MIRLARVIQLLVGLSMACIVKDFFELAQKMIINEIGLTNDLLRHYMWV